MTTSQLLWLRTDLRVQDNSALAAAMAAGPTVALFLLSPGQWQAHDDAPSKVDFWLRNLAELSRELGALNVPLLVRQADDWSAAPRVIAELCQQLQIGSVQVNEEYGVHESRRDQAVAQALDALGINFRSHLDQLLFRPGSVLTKSGSYFQVLGIGAAIGRTFNPDDNTTPGGHPVVVLGHDYWQSRFAGDPSVVGQTVVVNGQNMTILGVSAAGFSGVQLEFVPQI
ncbi:deoxyribodipyrimidine photo-lyase, partial [Pseudomonas sp.]|uniref:deoxyribodipyrimidine photo-lyase n=1 Tax=Pseudomonas sp. TaxID=306 RepID=UPI00299D92CA